MEIKIENIAWAALSILVVIFFWILIKKSLDKKSKQVSKPFYEIKSLGHFNQEKLMILYEELRKIFGNIPKDFKGIIVLSTEESGKMGGKFFIISQERIKKEYDFLSSSATLVEGEDFKIIESTLNKVLPSGPGNFPMTYISYGGKHIRVVLPSDEDYFEIKISAPKEEDLPFKEMAELIKRVFPKLEEGRYFKGKIIFEAEKLPGESFKFAAYKKSAEENETRLKPGRFYIKYKFSFEGPWIVDSEILFPIKEKKLLLYYPRDEKEDLDPNYIEILGFEDDEIPYPESDMQY